MPSSSLVPNDPSVLLTTAGMQQFKPYFIGKADPMKDFGSLNTASIQKSFRTSDIDQVGDERHLTFFEMMGNFSFGGYFKEEAITYAYDFLTEIGLQIEYVTIFAGDKKVPKDKGSKKIWENLGIKDIREAGRADNFWGPTGKEGPCGPTTEIYINNTEIWNIVFNEYYCKPDGTLEKLKTPGVDTGMGLERLAMISQGKNTIFETDLFEPLLHLLSHVFDGRQKRIIADHVRAIAFLILDGVRPSNKEAGYVLRRLMRRIIVYGYDMNTIFQRVYELYKKRYPELDNNLILQEFTREKEKFQKALTQGIQEIKRMDIITAPLAFQIYQSFGVPFEVIKEFGGQKASRLTREDFEKEFARHQEISRAGRERKFGGHGLLLDTGELKAANEEELKIVIRLHTATHLLQAGLRKVLGESVHQAGSDITAERTRFDFTFERKLTREEVQKIEDWVNMVIQKDVPMEYKEVPYGEAIKTGALYFEKEKYPSVVKIYSAFDPKSGEVFSKELCGGPHVTHTGKIGIFKILKEESVGAGIRRIRAIVK